MWVAEVVRMLRSVEFCREQAVLINSSIAGSDPANPPIRWEEWRDQEKARTVTWSYISVVLILVGAYLGGLSLGLNAAELTTGLTILVAGSFALVLLLVLWGVARVFIRWSSQPAKAGATDPMARVAKWLERFV
jgi:hypothetical protein